MSPTYPFYWKENKAVMPLLLFLSYISWSQSVCTFHMPTTWSFGQLSLLLYCLEFTGSFSKPEGLTHNNRHILHIQYWVPSKITCTRISITVCIWHLCPCTNPCFSYYYTSYYSHSFNHLTCRVADHCGYISYLYAWQWIQILQGRVNPSLCWSGQGQHLSA